MEQSQVGAYLDSQPGLDELQGVRQDGRHHASCRPGQQRDGQAGERGVGPVHQGGERLLGDVDSEQLQKGREKEMSSTHDLKSTGPLHM
jgi:hypothetical protein